ncbi:MAG: iron-siderophore ABC transporter substrate-binding protein [Deinococcota bacterium]
MARAKSIFISLLLTLCAAAYAQTCEDGFRSINHELGEACIPQAPSRIVSLNPMVTDNLVALGIEPIAIATFNGVDFTSYEYMTAYLADTPIVGRFPEPNLEAVLQLTPDLIIGRARDIGENYNNLSAIAPTVALADQSTPEAWLRSVTDVLGIDPSERLDAYDATMRTYAEQLPEDIQVETAAFLRVQPTRIRLYSASRLGGPILYTKLGLQMPNVVADIAEGESLIDVSLELLPSLADVDHIFLLDQSTEDDPAAIFDSPLWEALPAVQAGNVYPASRDIWINLGILASEEVAQSIVDALR